MPDLPFTPPSTSPQPFDLDKVNTALADAVLGMVRMMIREPGTTPSPAEAKAVMESVRQGLMAGSQACAEITRVRTDLAALRDSHRPQPHADPTKPGALCSACSVQGSIITWPCGTWSTAERILNHGKA
ncbi:hypothetical protein [Streptomyces sp. NPDC051452]|uniref:hypothetical protein n=1 Tax=Streptomyces sp. NPDC051452 TaxID=3365654 RepID=UPI0037B18AF3